MTRRHPTGKLTVDGNVNGRLGCLADPRSVCPLETRGSVTEMAMPQGTFMALTKSGGIGGEGAWATIGFDFADMFGLVRPRPREGRVGPLHPPVLAIVGSVVDVADQPGRGAAVCDVLAAWRAAERELATLSTDSPDWSEVQGKVLELRASYHQLFTEHLHRWPGT